MPRKIFFFLLLMAGLLIYSGPKMTQAVAEEIPTNYDDLYLVPFSEDNPAPIEETTPEPPPVEKPKPAPEPTPVEATPAEIKTAPVDQAPNQAQISAPSNQTPGSVQEPQAPATTETAPQAPNTEAIVSSELAETTVAPILAPFIEPVKQIKVAAKKIAVATADNKIAKTLPTPQSLEFTPESAKRQINLSLWLFLIVGLSATVINELVKKINERPSRFKSWWESKTGTWHDFFTNRPLVRKLLVAGGLLFYGALIVISETPETINAGLTTLAPVLIAITVFLLIKEGGEKIFLARSGAHCFLVFSGLEALVLVLGVILSRNVNLLPPLILSAPLVLVVLKSSQANEDAVKIKATILTLVAVAIFWLSSYFNNPIWRGAALLVCAVGIQDLFFNLIPLNPLPGYNLFKSKKIVWIILFALATTGFVGLILAPNSTSGNLNISWSSVAVYTGVAIAVWLSIKMNSRRTAKS